MSQLQPNVVETITLPLQDLIDNVLGDNHYCAISKGLAKRIMLKTLNQRLVFVQLKDEEDNELPLPVLWLYGPWVQSCERHRAAKARSDKERDVRNILAANIHNLSRCIRRQYKTLNDDQAGMIARKMIVENNTAGFEYFKLPKLITKAEEL